MRSAWNGSLTFGLLVLPVKLYSSLDDSSVKFHQVHAKDGARIQQKRVCTLDGEEVAYTDLAKGYEMADGNMVVFTDDELADLPLPGPKSAQILSFIPHGQVDEALLDKAYFIEPQEGALKAYVLLRDAMQRAGRVGLVHWVNRGREHLALLSVADGMLRLQTFAWPEQLRQPYFPILGQDAEISDAERELADMLLAKMLGEWNPGEHHSAYKAALDRAVQAKVNGVMAEQPAEEKPAQVLDISAVLQASVAAAKQREEVAA